MGLLKLIKTGIVYIGILIAYTSIKIIRTILNGIIKANKYLISLEEDRYDEQS